MPSPTVHAVPTPSATAADGLYVVAADYGDMIEIYDDETYSDHTSAWQQANKLQADADKNDEAIVYGVYLLTAAPR